ncbi:MAG: ABC transporter permease, partial [Thermomicrobium sp.]
SLGFFLGTMLPTASSAQIVGMVALYPMIFLTGAAMPRELLPERVHHIARYLPLDPVVQLLRATWAGETLSTHASKALLLIAITAASSLVVALRGTRT